MSPPHVNFAPVGPQREVRRGGVGLGWVGWVGWLVSRLDGPDPDRPR